MQLSKTDFKEFLICQKCLWLKKRRPEMYVRGEVSQFLQKLIRDGYEVEECFQRTFAGGVLLKGTAEELVNKTQALLKERKTIFQATFQTKQGLFAKIDVLEFDQETGKWNLHEVKSSSEIKRDLFHNHLKDIAFQKLVLEQAGIQVGKSFLVHLNKEYVRQGELDLDSLFVCEELSEEIEEIKQETWLEMQKALAMLQLDDVDLNGCGCIYRSCGQRCDCFALFNPQVPQYSTAQLFKGKKLEVLVNDDIFDIKDVPDDFKTTKNQKIKIELQKTGIPKIDGEKIKEILSDLKYPLHFLDYETFGKPIPLLDGYKPNSQIVFQYSLHILTKDGKLDHFEYLAEDLESATEKLLEALSSDLGTSGSVLVWNESFEKKRNQELAELHPKYKDLLQNLNSRVFDLMKIFKKEYQHPDFKGSASIKKVLPVLCPEFSYNALEVQNGAMAVEAWGKLMFEGNSRTERKQIRSNLLKYCELDTLAMVKLVQKIS